MAKAKPKPSTKKPRAGEERRSQEPTKDLSYGQASARLEEILHLLEEGEVDIDKLSGLVAEAAELVTTCRKKIQAAEVQVQKIAERLERDAPTPADDDE